MAFGLEELTLLPLTQMDEYANAVRDLSDKGKWRGSSRRVEVVPGHLREAGAALPKKPLWHSDSWVLKGDQARTHQLEWMQEAVAIPLRA